MVKRIIPIPPMSWIKLRQKRMPWGMASTFTRMEAPVVVNPDTDSKKASVMLSGLGMRQKGNMPKTVKKNHIEVTIR